MGTPDNNLLGTSNTQNVFAQAILQSTSLLDGVALLGISSGGNQQINALLINPTPSSGANGGPSSPFLQPSNTPSLFAPDSYALDGSIPLSNMRGMDPLTGSQSPISQSTTVTTPTLPNFTIMAEGTVTANGGGDFDGRPLDPRDDAKIYAGKGFTFNGSMTLPVQRDALGNILRDNSGKAILANGTIAVAQGYTQSNGPSNQYAGLVPPPVVARQTVNVPAYADLKQQELTQRIPSGTPTVTFDIRQNPILNATDWNRKFPAAGTSSQPKVVRVTNGSLTIPQGINLSNTVIIVESGDITLNNSQCNFNNVALITNSGNINLGNIQATGLSALASGSLTMSGNSLFIGNTLLATGTGDLTFNGATKDLGNSQNLRAISQGNIVFNGSDNTRGNFLTAKNFTMNGRSALLGTIGAKGNITFNGQTTVTAIAPTDTPAPTITAELVRDTAPGNTTNTDKLTFDATIAGSIAVVGQLKSFKAGFDNKPVSQYVNVMADRQADGTFRFSQSRLAQIFGGTLPDGQHTLHLVAASTVGAQTEDDRGERRGFDSRGRECDDGREYDDSSGAQQASTSFDLTFTLDTKAPLVSSPDLLAVSDSGRSNTDNITNQTKPQIGGTAEAGSAIQLFSSGQLVATTTTKIDGTWQVTLSNALSNGTYALTAIATDAAGNVSPITSPLSIVIDALQPTLTLTKPVTTAPIRIGDKLAGSFDGTGSSIASASYRFDNGPEIALVLNTTGGFDQAFNLTGITNGSHALTISTVDVAGNSLSSSYDVKTGQDSEGPVIAAQLVQDSGSSRSDAITFNPSISGVVTDASAISKFQVSVQGSPFGNVLPQRQTNGSFTLTKAQLESIYGGVLPDGVLTINLKAEDEFGNLSSVFSLVFTLDTKIAPPILQLDSSSDSGISNSDRITQISTPTISGLTEPSGTIQLFNGTTLLGTTVANASGVWSVVTSTLTNGQYHLTAISTDIAGNVSQPSTDLSLTIDAALPELTLTTNTTVPLKNNSRLLGTVSGTGSAIASSTYRWDNGPEITLATDGTGKFDQVLNLSGVTNGSHVLTFMTTDVAGNVLTQAVNVVLANDTVAPIIAAQLITDTGNSATDRITFNPNISGLLTDDNQVVSFQASLQGKPFVNVLPQRQSNGSFTLDRTQLTQINGGTLPDGLITLQLIAQDEFGNASTPVIIVFTLDTISLAPNNLVLVNDSGSSSSDRITNINTPTIRGLVEPNAKVQIFNGTTLIGETTADIQGIWQVTTSALLDGATTLSLISTDIAGNTSQPTSFNLLVDTLQPSLALGTTVNQPLKSNAKLTGQLDGTGSNLTAATYCFDNGQAIAINLNTIGNFDQSFDFTGITNGSHTLTIAATDVAGNIRSTTYTVEVAIDREAPVVGAKLLLDSGRSKVDSITFDARITGTVTDANTIASFKAGFDNVSASNFVNILPSRQPDGSFSFSLTQLETIYGGPIPDGLRTLNLQAQDEFGNTSAIFQLAFNLDTKAPDAPIVDLADSSDSGFSNTDNITRINPSLIQGLAEANSSVQIFIDGISTGFVIAANNGVWQFSTNNLTEGSHVVTAAAQDIAGNISAVSIPLNIIIDTTLPTLTLNGLSEGIKLQNAARLVGSASGTGSALVLGSYRFDNGTEKTIVINASGNFDQAFDFGNLTAGSHALTLSLMDAAGNPFTKVFNVIIAVDTTAPIVNAGLVQDTGSSATDRITRNSAISGTVTDESLVTVLKARFQGATTWTDISGNLTSNGGFSLSTAQLTQLNGGTLPDGTYQLEMEAADQFGNVSQLFQTSWTQDTGITLSIKLDPATDSAPIGDSATTAIAATLMGQTDPGSTVTLQQINRTTISDAQGNFAFSNVAMTLGSNLFTLVATDLAGNQRTSDITIQRLATNNAPTEILLTNNLITENSAAGTVLGSLSTIDPDAADTHQYTLLNDAGGQFILDGNRLKVAANATLNFEAQSQFTVRIRTTDSGNPGLFFDKSFVIQLVDINEKPSFTSTPILNGSTTTPYSYVITTADPENDVRTITADNLPTWLNLVTNSNGMAMLSGQPSIAQTGLYSINLKVTDSQGLSSVQTFLLAVDVVLKEDSRFNTSQSVKFQIPAQPSVLSFAFDPTFDLTDSKFINDAFEVALIDDTGKSIVHTIQRDRQSFFNLTEGEPVDLAPGVSYNPGTKTVSLNLTGVVANTNATLIFRLVNDDTDTTTQVKIRDIALTDAPDGMLPALQGSSAISSIFQGVDLAVFNQLSDVSSSVKADYGETSFDAKTKQLYTKVSLHNIGTYSMDAPLIVAIRNLSNPSVLVSKPDGFTPDGLPYFNFSTLVATGKFNPDLITASRDIAFYNPQQVQFSYDLVVLGLLNQAPTIQSQPLREELVGNTYRYQVKATDPNGDVLSYKLLMAPQGMTIDASTGLISWNPAIANLGNHSILVQASDGRGGNSNQQFTLTIADNIPNRAPNFVSTPIVDAFINQTYTYNSNAIDPDQDKPLTYSLVQGPDGMEIDPVTGKITWTPPAALILGDTIIGSISTPGQIDEFTFSGTAGQRLYFDMLKYSGSYSDRKFRIVAPGGQEVINSYNFFYSGYEFLTLQESGNYRVQIVGEGDRTGEYGFSVIDIAQTPIIQANNKIQGVLTPGTEDDIFRFNASKGQRLYIDTISNNGRIDWSLYNTKLGTVILNSFTDLEYEVTEDSEYLLILRGQENFNAAINYSFVMGVPSSVMQPLTLGTTIAGTISEKGEQDVYTFSGMAGQQLFLDNLQGVSSVGFRLYDPTGKEVFSSGSQYDYGPNYGGLVLVMNGQYRVVIDGYQEATGNYAFRLLDRKDTTSTINLDTDITGTFGTTISPSQTFNLILTEKKHLFFDGQSGSGSWQLFYPNGQLVTGGNISDNNEFELDAGNYWFVPQGGDSNNPNYKFQFVTSEFITQPMTLGSTITGQISKKGEQDSYTFSGTSGQQLFFDGLQTDSGITIQLYDPTGKLVFSGYPGSDNGGLVLQMDGQYKATVDGYDENIGNYAFRFLNHADITNTISLDTDITGTFGTTTSQSQTFNLVLSEKKRLFFNGQSGDCSWKLYGANGKEVPYIGGTLSRNLEFELDAGTYWFIPQSGDSNNPNYKFQFVTPEFKTLPMILGDNISGELTKKGSQNSYTFSGVAGQQLYFDYLQGNSSIGMKLYDPVGTEVFSGYSSNDYGPNYPGLILTLAGNYRFVIDGYNEATGPYNFRLLSKSEAILAPINSLISGSFTISNQSQSYQFELPTSRKIGFNSSSGTGTWTLYGPTGERILDSSLSVDRLLDLAPGKYWILFHQSGSTNLNYQLNLVDQGVGTFIQTTGISIGLNSVISGSINSSTDKNIYSLTASAGQQLFFDGLSGNVAARIYDQSGKELLLSLTNNNAGPNNQGLILKFDGIYTVIVESYYSNTGNYSFQLLSATNPPLVVDSITNSDSTITGSFSTLSETKLHRLSLNQKTYVYFDGIQGNHSWTLYKANGTYLSQGSTAYDTESWLDAGEYLLSVSRNDYDSNSNYEIKIVTPNVTSLDQINFGTTITGTLSEKGQQNRYSFQGQAGQKLFFDGLLGNDMSVEVFDPNGKHIVGEYGYTRADRDYGPNSGLCLTANGNYTILIDGARSESIGDYSFRLLNAAAAPLQIVNGITNSDPTFSGTFATQSETQLHRLSLNQRTYLYFDGLQGNHYWTLYQANGEPVSSASGSTSYDRELWVDSGEYILAVSRNNYDPNSSYSLQVINSSYSLQVITPSLPLIGSINYEDVIRGSLTEKGQQNRYTFQGIAGQQLFFDGLTGENMSVYIYDSNEKLILGGTYSYVRSSGDYGPNNLGLCLTKDDTYTIRIDGSSDESVGSYSFRLLNGNNAPLQRVDAIGKVNPLLSGSFNVQNETNLHRLNLNKKTYVYFDGTQGSSRWDLYQKNGTSVKSGYTSSDSEFYLEAGEYLVAFSGTDIYGLKILTPDFPELGTINYGETINGGLAEKGQQNIYKFQGEAGQQLFFDGMTGDNISSFVYDPSGRLVFGYGYYQKQTSGDFGPDIAGLHLSLDGTYTIIIDGRSDDSTGNYAFRLLEKAVATEISFNQDYSGNFGSGGLETKLYRFVASAGQEIYLDTASGQSPNNWVLYGPSGQVIKDGYLQNEYNDDAELKLAVAGEYLLALSGKGATNQSFQFNLTTVLKTKTELQPNQIINGALTQRGQQNGYTFTGQAGQRFFFDGLSGVNGLRAKLITPSQVQVLDYRVNEDSIPFTLTESGQYQLVIDGDRAITGAYSFQLQNLADVGTLPIGNAVSGTIAADRSAALYRLNGQIGQTFNFDWRDDRTYGMSWTLYGTNNQVLGESNWYYPLDFRVILPSTGTYTLVVSKTTPEAVNYGFTVANENPTTSVSVSGFDQLIGETEFSSRSGTLASGEVREYTFTAPAGTRIYLDSKDFDDDNLQISIINPDNSVIVSASASSDIGATLLSQSGTFKVRVQGTTASGSGDYNFSLIQLLTKAPGFADNVRRLTLNAEITKPLSPGRTTDILSFEGMVGQHLLFDGILPDGSNFYGAKVDAKLIGPSGQVIFDFKSSDYPYVTGATKDFTPFTLTEAGTYNLIIAGQQDSQSEYRFKMWDLDEAIKLLPNRVYADNLLRGSDTNLYKLSGTAGQRFFFNSIEGRSSDQWILYRLGNNQEMIRQSMNQDFEYALPIDGDYILAIQGGSTTPANYRFAIQAIQDPKAVIIPGKGESGGTQAEGLGIYPVRIKVSDGKGGIDEQTFKIRVNPKEGNAIPYIVSEAQRLASTKTSYRYDVNAIDADNDVLTYTLADAPSGMLIDNSTGEILWRTPIAGTHNVKIRVADTNGGVDYQSFELIIDGNASAHIFGTVFDDLDKNGVRKLTNPNNLTPYTGVTVGDRFKQNYTPYDLGIPKGIPMNIGAITFYKDANGVVDPNTLLVAGSIESCGGVIFKVKVQRGDGGHIIAFDDDFDPETPYVAEFFAYSPYISAGLVYDPISNTLITSSGKGAYTGLTYVPTGISGAGDLKSTGRSGEFYTAGNQNPAALTPGGSSGLIYMAANSPNFDLGAELLLANRITDLISAYQIDGNGNPIVGTATPFLKDISRPMGAAVDPITGDTLFSASGPEVDRKNTILVVRGLGELTGNEPGLGDRLVYVDRNKDGVRNINEEFTYTDKNGGYQFYLAPGNYQIRQELQAGWTQTTPTNPAYRDVTLVSNQLLYGVDFGNFGSPANVPNLDPNFSSNPILQILTDQRYLYRSTASDLNGDVLTFELVQGPLGMAISQNGVVAWQPNDQQVGSHQVILRVKDGKGGIDLQAYTLKVDQENRRPVITSQQPSDTAIANKTFRYQVSAYDSDGDALTYSIVPNREESRVLPNSASIDSRTGVLTWTPTIAQVGGAYVWGPDNDLIAPWQVTIKVTDGKGGEGYQQVNLLVDAPTANRAPEIISKPRTSINVGTSYAYQVEAKDLDGDRLTYALAQGPVGMTIDQGVISWKPTAEQLGKYSVVVNVSDGQLTTQQRWEISTLTGASNTLVNHAPTITSSPQVVTNVGDLYEYHLVASDIDQDALYWTLESGPKGMVVDRSTLTSVANNQKVGTLRWSPTDQQLGAHEVTLRVVDVYGAFSTQTFTVLVTGINAPPDIVSLPLTKIGVGDRYNYQVIATDPEQDPLVYTVLKKPEGMTIHPTTGVISWQPTASQIGSQSIEILVQDPNGGQAIQRFNIVVDAQSVNHAPAITSTPVFVAGVGTPYSYQVVANDPDAGNTLTYQLLSGPAGMAIDAVTGRLSWATPTTGIYQVVVGSVDQGGLGAAQGFSLTVRTNHAPVITSTGTTTIALGSTYRYDVRAADVDGDNLSYRLNQGAIDRGVRIDERGRIFWTPQGTDLSTPVAVEVSVTDTQNAIVTEQFSIRVIADTEAPQVLLKATKTFLNVGEAVTFEARATDNVSVAGLMLRVNGQAIVLDADGRATVKFDSVQTINAVAMAIDGAGNSANSASLLVDVVDPTGAFDPIFGINANLLPQDFITKSTPVFGSVGGTGFARYELAIALLGTENFNVIASGNSVITDGKLGTIDPSLLLNDAYSLRLMVYGTNGSVTYTEETVNVAGELKLGNFRLSFTDLAVPVTGIPITLTRTYDTLTANEQDDFGFGWRMEFRDTNLRTSVGKRSEEDEILDRFPAFDDRTKVFITLPGGKREAYSFKPKIVEETADGSLGILAKYFYDPIFESEKGSTNKLSIEYNGYVRKLDNGKFINPLGTPPFNPADSYYGGVYVLTTKEGVKYRIDAATGDLRTVTDTNGNTLTYTDDAITSSIGQKVTFERDAQGRIRSVKDPMQEFVRYDYDNNGDLIQVTDQEKNVTKFVYDGTYDDPNIAGVDDGGRSRKAHYLRSVIDPLNRVGARLDYDPVTGRLIKTTNAAGQTIETSYDPANSIQTIKDAAGSPTEYEYDIRGNVVRQTNAIGATVSLKYDDVNNPTSVTETRDALGIVTKYQYDVRGNLTWKTEGYCGCAGVVPGKTYYTYDSFGNMTNLVLPTGASMVMDYDSKGQMRSMKDGKGNVIQAFTYYDNGLTKTETDTSGTSQYFYDTLGNLTKSVDPNGSITRMEYSFNGKLKKMTEDKGTPNDLTDDEVSTFDYDKLGREKLADYGDGIWVKYDYEGAGGEWSKLEAPTIGKMERKLTSDGKLAGWVTPNGGTPTFIYDAAGRLWKETDESGMVATEYTYDQVGRVKSIKDVKTGAVASKNYDLGNRVTEEVDPLLGFVRYEYYGVKDGSKLKSTTRGQYVRNAASDLIVDTTVALQTMSYEYNGSRTTVIDPLGRRTTAVQDEYALPTETIFENRNGNDYKVTQSYLYANNLQEAKDYPTRIVDIGGNDRKYTYDTTGRLKTATDLGDGIYTYSYGDNGLAMIESPLSRTKNGAIKESVAYAYDDLGNLASVKYSDQVARTMTYHPTDNRLGKVTLANGDNVTYDYNNAGQITSQNGTGVGTTTMTYTASGSIKTVTDGTGTTTYAYDSQTNQLSRINNSNGSSIAYTYDLAGRVKTQTERAMANGTGYMTEYDYDTFGNLKSVKDPTGGITTLMYDVLNRLTDRKLPNNLTSTWTYDALDRIESVTHKDAQGNILSSVTYDRKASGEPTTVTREDGTYTKLMYDDALRVTKESFYNVQNVLLDETTYVYDAAGKRIAKVTALGNQTYNYDKGYQLDSVTSTNPEDYAYDTNGRMDLIQRDGQTLDLDHDVYDRLTAVKNLTSSATTQYVYDGQGRRITATNGNQTRNFLVAPVMGGGLDSTDMMLDGAGNMTANYIYGGGSSPFMKLDANGNAVYYLTDGMGSTIGMANQSGQSMAKFSYDSFGDIRNQSGSLADTTGGDFRFQGQWLETATGIYNFRARDYDSKTGTFLSRDPVSPHSQQPEAMNPYQGMYNNPYIYSDPSGKFSIMEINAAQSIETSLSSIRTYGGHRAKEYVKEKIGEAFSEIVASVFKYFVPGTSTVGKLLSTVRSGGSLADDHLENLIKGVVCEYFEGIPLIDNLRLYPRVQLDGTPSGGVTCGPSKNNDPNIEKRLNALPGSRPEFIFVNGNYTRNNPNGFLIGDIKLTQKAAVNDINSNDNQWQAMSNYAREWQMLPFVSYLSLIETVPGGQGVSKSDKKKMAEKAFKQHVILTLVNLID